MLSQLIVGVILCILWDLTGKGCLEACTSFPQDFNREPFPLADFALYPFGMINRNHEDNDSQFPLVTVIMLHKDTMNPELAKTQLMFLRETCTSIYTYPTQIIILNPKNSSSW